MITYTSIMNIIIHVVCTNKVTAHKPRQQLLATSFFVYSINSLMTIDSYLSHKNLFLRHFWTS